MFEIIVLKDGVEQGRLTLSVPISTIGRSDNNQIILAEDSVSRRHARLVVEGTKLFVEDLRSGNGTFMNNSRIEGRLELHNGSEVQITPFTLKIVDHIPQEPTAPQDIRTVMIPALGPMPPPGQPAAPSPTGAKLILRRGEAGKSSYNLTTKPMTVGRSEDRDIILTDPASSRRHATITFEVDHYFIKDEGSANGIQINSVTLREGVINHGDRVIVGETEFEFIWPSAPQRVQASAFPSAPSSAVHPPNPPGSLNAGVDPYSETGIMPAYGNWPGQVNNPLMPASQFPAGGSYSTELGSPVTQKRRPIRLIAVVVMVLAALGIGVSRVSQKNAPTGQQSVSAVVDPCLGYGESCPDPTDQTCLNCISKRSRVARGQELFAQKEFSAAISEFQRILVDFDSGDYKATSFKYISYEYWVITTMEQALRDQVQTVSEKLVQMEQDIVKARELVDRYSRMSYTKDTPESTLESARARLNEAVSILNGVSKKKVEDPKAQEYYKEADSLRSRATGQIGRMKRIKEVSAQETFTQNVSTIFEEAQALKSSGSLVKAQNKFEEVMRKDPVDKTGLASQSEQEIRAISSLLKDRAKPLLNDAINKIKNEQWTEARKKLNEALKIDPNLTEAKQKLAEVNEECVRRAKKLYNEAKVQYNVTQYSQAEKLLRQVLELVPDSSEDIHQKSVKLLQDMGKY